jgi:HAD superfamily hydrolase (TIGR01509 family)
MTDEHLRAVLFDMDGVLVDSYEAWFYVMQAAVRDLGGRGFSRETYHESWGQSLDDDAAAFFPGCTRHDLQAYLECHFPAYAHHVVAEPQAAEVLAALEASHVRTAIVTNTPPPIAQATLRPSGIHADILVGDNGVLRPKPAPDMIVRACELLDVAAGQALMVGDSRFDQQAAAAAGVRFVGYGGIDAETTVARLSDVLELL